MPIFTDRIADVAFRTAEDGQTCFRPFYPNFFGLYPACLPDREYLVPEGDVARLRRRWRLLLWFNGLVFPHTYFIVVILVLILGLADPTAKERYFWVDGAYLFVSCLPWFTLILINACVILRVTRDLPIHDPQRRSSRESALVAAEASSLRLLLESLALAGYLLFFAAVLILVPWDELDNLSYLPAFGLILGVPLLLYELRLVRLKRKQREPTTADRGNLDRGPPDRA